MKLKGRMRGSFAGLNSVKALSKLHHSVMLPLVLFIQLLERFMIVSCMSEASLNKVCMFVVMESPPATIRS